MGGMKSEDAGYGMRAAGWGGCGLRVAWGRCEFKVPGSMFKVGTEMKKARITAYLRLFPLSPLILHGGSGGRGILDLRLAILDWGDGDGIVGFVRFLAEKPVLLGIARFDFYGACARLPVPNQKRGQGEP